MRNGFKLTLMVAIALMGMRASAMVPTINPIPDPIVGDSDGATGTGEFVFPDALNLDQYGSDPDGPSPLIWSYEGVDGKYTFNGVAGLNGADPIDPGALSINDQVLGGEQNPDANAATVTIRNADMSPIGGPNVDDSGIPAGIIDSETRVITLYASDGATVGQRDITVYTDNEGEDRLSINEEFVASDDFAAGPNGWQFTNNASSGTVSSSSDGGELCITVSAAGLNDAFWASPYDVIELTDGSVYIGRYSLNTSQVTVGSVPLVIVSVENSGFGAFDGASLYFADAYFLDNFGGANAPAGHPEGNAQHMTLFTPLAVSTQEWKDNAFNATNDPINDARLRFRILDFEGVGYGAENDSGEVCLNDYQITKVDVGAMARGAALYEDTSLAAGDVHFTAVAGNTTGTFSGGALTLTPTSGNWDNEVITVSPGDGVFDVIAGTGLVDDYPVPWTADGQLFELAIDLSAPSATGETNGPDVIRMGIDAPTQEFIGLTWMTPSLNNIGMPNQGTPQTFRTFVAPNDVTLSTITDNDRLRPRFDALVANNLGWNGNPFGTNAGGITLHNIAVYEVTY